ncbi:venom protease-like [Venturia canescens]|uniref:venom protease-like n=1 Tax=Venturia canescens TaxID=32260 RepID=UPI001C9D3344|nr:venom protease-like [Venturia canescens]
MCLKIGLVLFLTLLSLHQSAGQGDACEDQGGEVRCVPFESCESLSRKLNGRRLQISGRSKCTLVPFQNIEVKVCCPYEIDYRANDSRDTSNQGRNARPEGGWNNRIETRRYEVLQPPVCGISNATFPKVINGEPADLGAWPWATLLGYRSRYETLFNCGGALISSRHVLTAAHCVTSGLYLVRVGELDIEDPDEGATPIDLLIENVTVHPQYDSSIYRNDIAVLRLERDVEFTELIRPICLPTSPGIFGGSLNKAFPFIVGWGALKDQIVAAAALQQVKLPIVAEEKCKAAYSKTARIIDESVLCAGYEQGGKDACVGDSGGPMMLPIARTWYSIGVISFGSRGCGVPGIPSVYAKTEYFLDFIVKSLN